MKNTIQKLQNFYFSKPNFLHRLTISFLVILPISLIWGFICDIFLTYILNDSLPDMTKKLFDLFHTKLMIIFFVGIITPLLETLLFQKWAFQISCWFLQIIGMEKKWGAPKTITISTYIAASFFAYVHISNHYFYPIAILPIAIALGWIYKNELVEFKSKSRAFWMICGIHALNNTFALTLTFLTEI